MYGGDRLSLTDEMMEKRRAQMSTLSEIEDKEINRLVKEAEDHRHRQILETSKRHNTVNIFDSSSKFAFAQNLVKGANTEVILQSSQLLFYKTTFSGIVAALEARDAYTSHHSESVTIMAERFCKIIGLPLMHMNVVTVTASVHDIGKVGISDATLKKPTSLDDDEWDEMKTHASLGAEIMQKAGPNLEYIAAGIRAHHEKWDGTGYPDNLKGADIPYPARIISICDSTDAMLSSRVYRKHLTKDICKEELRKNKGIMYQPELVDIFLENWDKIVGDLYDDID